jgi:hypothetical protein
MVRRRFFSAVSTGHTAILRDARRSALLRMRACFAAKVGAVNKINALRVRFF